MSNYTTINDATTHPQTIRSHPVSLTSVNDRTNSLIPSSGTNTIISMPMPTPGSPGAPFFKGKRVMDFLAALEAHATTAGVPLAQLPSFVLRYCHHKVRIVIENSAHFAGTDWNATKDYIINFYASEDLAPYISPERLRSWTKNHSKQRTFNSLRDVDRYYREFTAQSSALLTKNLILSSEVDLLFYQGIPKDLRLRIREQIPAAYTKRSNPPTVVSVLTLLRKEFDEDDLDFEHTDISFDSDSESSDSPDDDSDISTKKKTVIPEPHQKTRRKKKTSPPEPLVVPATSVVDAPAPPTIESLTKQMEELQLIHAKLQQSLQISANATASTSSLNLPRCFICGKNHRTGLINCPEVPRLVTEGLAVWTSNGRLSRPDSTDLPRVGGAPGGVAKALRNERNQSLKGKAREHSPGPSYVNLNAIQREGIDVFRR